MIGISLLKALPKVCYLDQSQTTSFVLLERGGELERGPLPFRFENMWQKADGFKDLVSEWWQSTEVSGVGSYILMEKIKALQS